MADEIQAETKPQIKLFQLFNLLAAYVIIILFLRTEESNSFIYYLLIFVLCGITSFTVWLIFGIIKMGVNETQLIIKYFLFFIPFRKDVFEISHMKVIRKLVNTKSNDPDAWMTISIIGPITYTPKWSLIYSIHPVLIQFKYINNLQIVVGRGWKAFDADKIISEIEAQQSLKIIHKT